MNTQECVLSPWLFNMFVDGVVRAVGVRKLGVGVEMNGGMKVSQLLFADDTVLVANSEAMLSRLVKEFGRVCERRKLKVNVGKSKVMVCSRNGNGNVLNVELDGERLETVDCFKYLGSVLAADGKSEKDVSQRIVEGCKLLGAMKGMFKCRTVSMNAKRSVYEGVVVPTVLYGAETWSVDMDIRHKINVFEMKCLRGMVGVTRLDRMRNERVRERAGIQVDLAGRVKIRVLSWFVHLERISDGRITKSVWRAEVKLKPFHKMKPFQQFGTEI